MNKRVFIICVILLMFIMPLALQIVLAQIPGIDTTSPEQIPEQLEQLKNQSAWVYLGQRFQVSLMKNPVIAAIDGFFNKMSFIFQLLFGMPYSLSLTLLFVIALWIAVFFNLAGFLNMTSPLSKPIHYMMSLLAVILIAQTGAFSGLINLAGTVIFAREAWWARWLLGLAFLFGFALFLYFLPSILKNYMKKQKEQKEKQKTELAQKKIQATAKAYEILGKAVRE